MKNIDPIPMTSRQIESHIHRTLKEIDLAKADGEFRKVRELEDQVIQLDNELSKSQG